MVVPVCLTLCWAAPDFAQDIEPQPLPDGVQDSGINVLFDSSHQFAFFAHWGLQDALREAGHRSIGSQASLNRVLTPGSRVCVRDQASHAWGTHRPFGELPAPDVDVIFTYQHADYQPYLPEERAAVQRFVEAGGGLILDGSTAASPLGRWAEELGARLTGEAGQAGVLGGDPIPGLGADTFPRQLRMAEFGEDWTVLVGEGRRGALARRTLGEGIAFLLSDPQLLHTKVDGQDQPNRDLLSWLVTEAAGDRPRRTDERRAPWEYGGLGGALYPENEMRVGGVRVQYADNQLPDIIELARTRFPELMDLLQKMLPTPPNPGEAYYINLAAGAGGGWAENAITPKLAGTISIDHDGILSVLAHELAHTMYGPEATDGTPGCGLPGWFSEAHAGWFQRKVGREFGFDSELTHYSGALAREDPLLDGLDLANIPEGKMGLAWHKAWFIWSILDARYGGDWYAKWLAHIHKKYNDPSRALTMDEYVLTVSEAVGEDVAPLFERLGTTVTQRSDLPPIAPK
jgi:hypothetical protein